MRRPWAASSARTRSWATPRNPDSRHLYAYGGEPVGRWDPDGLWSASDWIHVTHRVYTDARKSLDDLGYGINVVCFGTYFIVAVPYNLTCAGVQLAWLVSSLAESLGANLLEIRDVWRTKDRRGVSVQYRYQWTGTQDLNGDPVRQGRITPPHPWFEAIYKYPVGSEYANICASSNGTGTGDVGFWCERGPYDEAWTSMYKKTWAVRGWSDKYVVDKSPRWPN